MIFSTEISRCDVGSCHDVEGADGTTAQILVGQHRLQDFGIDADMMLDVDFHAARSGYREGTPAPRSEIHYR
eukprot:COSAG01_NODE_44878_length_414_cov_2.063492_1_plen_72_part_00